jgi:hypothetical protein
MLRFEFLVSSYSHSLLPALASQIILYTHSVNGVTLADIQLAKHIDELPVEYSRKWAREHVDLLGPEEMKYYSSDDRDSCRGCR